MSKPCTVCAHAERSRIDTLLITGTPAAVIARKFQDLGECSVRRHKAGHLPSLFVLARQVGEITHATDLLDQLRVLHERALRTLEDAEKVGDTRTVLLAMREARQNLELLARIAGEIDERPQINVLMSPEWIAIQEAMFEALQPYPEARYAAAARIAQLTRAEGA